MNELNPGMLREAFSHLMHKNPAAGVETVSEDDIAIPLRWQEQRLEKIESQLGLPTGREQLHL